MVCYKRLKLQVKYVVSFLFSYLIRCLKLAEREKKGLDVDFNLRLGSGFKEMEQGHNKGLVELGKQMEH